MVLAVSSYAATETEWTVMVYLDGDNNLESYGVDNFLQMAKVDGLPGGASAKVRVLVQFDRSDGFDTSYDNWTGCKRFEITTGLTPRAANAWQSLGPTDMGVPQTLTDFVNWGIVNAPAARYALVLWDHGSGWGPRAAGIAPVVKAVCYDDTSGHALTTQDLRTALQGVATNIDLIGFDACLMDMIEVAYEVKAEASVFVASEQLEDAAGWPYDTILQALVANPDMSAAGLGTAIVNLYGASPTGSTGTMAAIDLTQVQGLADAISAFADTVLAESNQEWDVISASRDGAHYYDDTAFRDLQSFMSGVATFATNSLIKDKAQAVVDVFNSGLLIANYTSASDKGNGLSIYFPPNHGTVDTDYATTNILFAEKSWDEFLDKWVKVTVPPPPNDNFANRIALSGETASATAATSRATKEDGEPDHAPATTTMAVSRTAG
ncbi:MAG: clostripain-related cysteine peptidase [Planctomycetota bacterium]|nr:clostripain-related cysteine peptidase [Planctomycetota bacterium]